MRHGIVRLKPVLHLADLLVGLLAVAQAHTFGQLILGALSCLCPFLLSLSPPLRQSPFSLSFSLSLDLTLLSLLFKFDLRSL